MSEVDKEFDRLMQGIREGSDEAMREFVGIYGKLILQAVRRWLCDNLRSKFDSADFVQNVWVTFFRKPLDQYAFDRSEALIAYLVTLAQQGRGRVPPPPSWQPL